MRKITIVLAAVALCGQVFAQGTGKAMKEFKGSSGVLMGPVTAINVEKGEIIVGDSRLIKAGPRDIELFKVGDELVARLHNGELKLHHAGEKKAPEKFKGAGGVFIGTVSGIDMEKNEITIGGHSISVEPEDIAGLKPGDEVSVRVPRKGKAMVRKAGEAEGPVPLNAKSGVVLGSIAGMDTAKGEVTIGVHVVTVDPKDLAGLKIGDPVTVEIREGKASISSAK